MEAPTIDPMTVVLKDGREFTIQPINARTPEGVQPAARLWFNGSVIHTAIAESHQEAMDKLFADLKELKRTVK